MKLFKLTDSNDCTHSNTKWSKGFTLTLSTVKNPVLCTDKVIHAYKNINLAFLLNPIHANFRNPNVWEAEGEICVEDWDKVGCFELTTIRQLAKPTWVELEKDLKVRGQFAVLCAESALSLFESKYPQEAIEAAKEHLKLGNAAAYAAYAAAYADAYAYAADAAARATRAAAYAAYAAAYAANVAAYAAAAYAAAYAANVAAYAAAAYAVAYAADAAARAIRGGAIHIDFSELANRAVHEYSKE